MFDLFIDGKWINSAEKLEVINPYTNKVYGRVSTGGEKEMDHAIEAAHKAFAITKKSPVHLRVDVLKHIAKRIKEEREDFAKIIASEAGKPLKDSRIETDRAINTFTIAAEEVSRIGGEYLSLDTIAASTGRFGITKRFPRGPVAAITPFNFPLNLVAHKVAPAIAAGNPVIIKPSSQTPVTALKLAGIIGETEWPSGGINAIPCSSKVAEKLAVDDRIKVLSFTGSPSVGWYLKKLAHKKQVTLELGGNAGVIVHDDANPDFAVKRCIVGSYSFSGQVCISVQRIYLHRNIYDRFIEKFLEQTKKLKYGDPLDESTDIGPMINPYALKKAKSLIQEAVSEGARIICGGNSRDNFLEATVLTEVKPEMKVSCEEAFAPLVCISPYDDFYEALSLVNNSRYGLQCGVFTKDITKIIRSFEKIDVGGLIINDIPTFRIDHMPYGGVKDSGFGREGLKYAIEEMTEMKLMVINTEG